VTVTNPYSHTHLNVNFPGPTHDFLRSGRLLIAAEFTVGLSIVLLKPLPSWYIPRVQNIEPRRATYIS
jgi:hypothetical protein